MAGALPRLYHLATRLQGARVVPGVQNRGFVCGQCRRQERRRFHSAPVWRKKRDDGIEGGDTEAAPEKKEYQFSTAELTPDELARYEAFSPGEQKIFRDERKQIYDALSSDASESELQGMVSQLVKESERDAPHIENIETKRVPAGFWNMGEVEKEDSGEDEEFEGDDLTELGHAELEQHREMREYARIAAWEMPLLSKIATSFKPPDMEHPLRFRYTTYMGEQHPAAKKIVLEFSPSDLPGLTDAQRIKLIKLAGPRYNPTTDIVKMSSEMFETQAQNKRYLGDLVDTLMAEAKDGTDMFEDIPLDFRHHKEKKQHVFPEEWRMTGERKARLEEERKSRLVQEQQRLAEGKVVDGREILNEALAAMPVKDDSRLLANQQRGGKKGASGRQTLR